MRTRLLAAAAWTAFLFVLWSPGLGAQANAPGPETSAEAGETSSDFLIVTGSIVDTAAPAEDRSGEFDWLHSSGGGTLFDVGTTVYQMGNAHWMFGQGETSFYLAPRWNLDLRMNLGAGNNGASGFLYQKYSAKATYSVNGRMYVGGQEEFIDIGPSNGHLLGANLTVVPSRLLSADFGYNHSAGGNLGTEFVSERLDLNFRAVQWFAGVDAGTAAPAVFQLEDGQPAPPARLVDGFGGVTVPVSVAKVILAWERLEVGAARRTSLTCSVKFPIGRR